MARSPTTRMGLLEVRARRLVAQRGARLLRAKREVLSGELVRLMRQVLEGRATLDEALREAVRALELARALEGAPRVASLGWNAGRVVPVEVTPRRVWGVPTPEVSGPPLVRAPWERGASPASFSPSAAEAARRHEEALEILLRIATRELHLARLGEEIRATSRRINALEQLLLPQLDAEARRVAGALDERDREDAVRLKRFRGKRARRGA
jgi:V/A-type H+/Na+-transporting ATPase subunit D